MIILFIKLQCINQIYQAFKPLHISNFNLDYNLSLNPTALLFVWFPIYLYYLGYIFFHDLDLVYTSKDFYASNQIGFQLMYSPLGMSADSLHTRDLYHPVNALFNKIDIRTKEKC